MSVDTQHEFLLSKKLNQETPDSLSRLTTTCLTTLGVVRVGLGAACVLMPTFTASLFRIPVTPGMTLPLRMFGIRDLVLGELLLTADRTGNDQHKETSRALWAGIASDAVDIGSTALALQAGSISKSGASFLGVGAAFALLLGIESMIGVRKWKNGHTGSRI